MKQEMRLLVPTVDPTKACEDLTLARFIYILAETKLPLGVIEDAVIEAKDLTGFKARSYISTRIAPAALSIADKLLISGEEKLLKAIFGEE